MAKVHVQFETRYTSYRFPCPGCKFDHVVHVRHDGRGVGWDFNGSRESPTFNPSVKVTRREDEYCHFYVRDGKIEFLPDCSHELAGKTVEMEYLHEQAITDF